MEKKSAGGEMKPEYRLPLMVPGSIGMPLGLFLYGWTLHAHAHWIAPIVGTAVIGFSLMVTMIPIQTYLVDAFTLYSASVSAAVRVLTSFAGAWLPSRGSTSLCKAWLGLGALAAGFHSISVPTGTVRLYFLWRAYSETIEARPQSVKFCCILGGVV